MEQTAPLEMIQHLAHCLLLRVAVMAVLLLMVALAHLVAEVLAHLLAELVVEAVLVALDYRLVQVVLTLAAQATS